MTSGTINDSTKTYSWTLNLFWILVPLTIASGIWDLGGGEAIAFVGSAVVTIVYGIITLFRVLDNIPSTYTWKKTFYGYAQGVIWGGSMIFAWPDRYTGYIYLILLFVNFCLMMMRRLKS